MAANRSQANSSARYRIVAAEAHSWSSLLLEDDRGQRYLHVVGTQALTKVAPESAENLLTTRAYRPWRGDRSWSALDQLPLIGQAGQASGATPSPDVLMDFAVPEQGDIQPS